MVLALAFALMAVAWGAGAMVAAIIAHRTAQNAADLAALAAAERIARAFDGCSIAGDIATANGARLVSCVVEGSVVTIEVGVAATAFGFHADSRARARAGP